MTASSSQIQSKNDTAKKTLILGVGNPILRDDGVGIFVLKKFEKKYSTIPTLEFLELSTGGLSLAEQFIGYDRVIMIDGLALEDGSPGKVHKLSIDDFASTIHSYCAHDCNLATAYALLKKDLGAEKLPSEVIIIGIEIEEFDKFGDTLSEKVQQAVPKAIALIEHELSDLLKNKEKNV